MNLRNIETKDEFYKFADIWYQRVHKLRAIWQNDNETPYRRLKAIYLWNMMINRIFLLHSIAVKFNQPKLPTVFKQGGVFYGQ